MTDKAFSFLLESIINPHSAKPAPNTLYNMFYWSGRKLFQLERRHIHCIILHSEESAIKKTQLRVSFFDDPFVIDVNEDYSSAVYCFLQIFEYFFMTKALREELAAIKKTKEKCVRQLGMVQELMQAIFVNQKVNIDCVGRFIEEEGIVLGKEVQFQPRLKDLTQVLQNLDAENVLLFQDRHLGLEILQDPIMHKRLRKEDMNGQCSYCAKKVVHWRGDFKGENGKGADEAQFLGSSRMTHYCSFECKYFHKFEHNAFFDCAEEGYFEDCLFRVYQVAGHPHNNFSNIQKTINAYFQTIYSQKSKSKKRSKSKLSKSKDKLPKTKSKNEVNIFEIFEETIPEGGLEREEDSVQSRVGKYILEFGQLLIKMGFQNIGNTCYMNSVLQLVLSTCDQAFSKLMSSDQTFFKSLQAFRQAPLTLGLFLTLFEATYASYDFEQEDGLKHYLSMYLNQRTNNFLANVSNVSPKASKSNSNSDSLSDIEETKKKSETLQEEGLEARGQPDPELVNQSSTKFERQNNQATEAEVEFQNKVNPVLLKYFIGCRREEFAFFGQADGHELFLTLLDLLSEEKTSLGVLVNRNFAIKLINVFTCNHCGFKKSKKESSNIISVSFENAVKAGPSANLEVMVMSTKRVEQITVGCTSEKQGSINIPGFEEYMGGLLLKGTDEKDDKEIKKKARQLNPLVLKSAKKVTENGKTNTKNDDNDVLKIDNFLGGVSTFTGMNFPYFDIINSKYADSKTKDFGEFMGSHFSLGKLIGAVKYHEEFALHAFNPVEEYPISLKLVSLQSYKIHNLVHSNPLMHSRLLSVSAPKQSIYSTLFTIFKFFESLLLNYYYSKHNIQLQKRVANFRDLFENNLSDEEIAQLLFDKEFDLALMFGSRKGQTQISEESGEEPGLGMVNNLTIGDEEEGGIPDYFEDLLDFLRLIFSQKMFKVYLMPSKQETKHQKLLHKLLSGLKQQTITSETSKIISEDSDSDSESPDCFSSTKTQRALLNSNSLTQAEKSHPASLDFSHHLHSLDIELNHQNILVDLLSKLRALQKKQYKAMNSAKEEKNWSVHDCLRGFFQSSNLELNCSKCKIGKEFSTCYKLNKTPQFLAIHLKRFMPRVIQGEYQFVKNSERVKVDKRMEINGQMYLFDGVVNHFGKINAGHYTFDRLVDWGEEEEGKVKVIEYDDAKLRVYHYRNKEIMSKDAYMLLYKRADY